MVLKKATIKGDNKKNQMDTILRKNINQVGYVDWTVRDFYSFKTEYGVTYNAYPIQDDNSVLIDTVKKPYASRLGHLHLTVV